MQYQINRPSYHLKWVLLELSCVCVFFFKNPKVVAVIQLISERLAQVLRYSLLSQLMAEAKKTSATSFTYSFLIQLFQWIGFRVAAWTNSGYIVAVYAKKLACIGRMSLSVTCHMISNGSFVPTWFHTSAKIRSLLKLRNWNWNTHCDSLSFHILLKIFMPSAALIINIVNILSSFAIERFYWSNLLNFPIFFSDKWSETLVRMYVHCAGYS